MGGHGRGRGGRPGIFKGNHERNSRNESVLDRLGKMPVYQKSNERPSSTKKYKFVRPSPVTSSVATLPPEARIRMLSKRFLKSYYEIFDKPGRPNLDSQYNVDAFFSISSTYPMPSFGRNLLQVQGADSRVSLLVHNKTNIAGVLATQFSPTEHLVNFLSCDVPFYIVNPMSIISMHIVVTGVFKDTTEATNPLKAFTRVFVVKLVSADKQDEPVYEIFNDLFMLQIPTPDQIKRYHNDAQIAKRLSTNQHDRPNASSSDILRRQEEMLQFIISKTKMNRAASKRLLEDFKWDTDEAMATFNSLYATNQIPQELFKPD